MHIGHSKRNNEPFMEAFISMNIKQMLKAQGFDNISIKPFEEADGTLASTYKSWRFPWTIIEADKAI
jgi:hypothetical protein